MVWLSLLFIELLFLYFFFKILQHFYSNGFWSFKFPTFSSILSLTWISIFCAHIHFSVYCYYCKSFTSAFKHCCFLPYTIFSLLSSNLVSFIASFHNAVIVPHFKNYLFLFKLSLLSDEFNIILELMLFSLFLLCFWWLLPFASDELIIT